MKELRKPRPTWRAADTKRAVAQAARTGKPATVSDTAHCEAECALATTPPWATEIIPARSGYLDVPDSGEYECGLGEFAEMAGADGDSLERTAAARVNRAKPHSHRQRMALHLVAENSLPRTLRTFRQPSPLGVSPPHPADLFVITSLPI